MHRSHRTHTNRTDEILHVIIIATRDAIFFFFCIITFCCCCAPLLTTGDEFVSDFMQVNKYMRFIYFCIFFLNAKIKVNTPRGDDCTNIGEFKMCLAK